MLEVECLILILGPHFIVSRTEREKERERERERESERKRGWERDICRRKYD